MADWLGMHDNATTFLYTRDTKRQQSEPTGHLELPKLPAKHLLTMCDLTKPEVIDIMRVALAMKASRKAFPDTGFDRFSDTLKGYSLLTLFEKPSLRTRVSLEVGMHQLGGQAIFYSISDSPLGVKESIEDTGKVLSRMCQGVTARVNSRKSVRNLAMVSTIPVINALDDYAHPMQMLADLLTVIEHKGTWEGITMAYLGDLENNVTYDLMRTAALMGYTLHLAGVGDIESCVWDECRKLSASSGGKVSVFKTAKEAVKDVDVIYCDSWMSYGIPKDEEEARKNLFMPFQVDSALLKMAKPDCIFMNCLPAARGMEQTTEVIDGPQSVVFDQAENRLHAQKALLVHLLAPRRFAQIVSIDDLPSTTGHPAAAGAAGGSDVLVVGGGGREHAIAVKLRESSKVRHVFCAPGNGGTAAEERMTNLAIPDSDIDGLLQAAKERSVALVFVGPEAPLCAGLADACAAAGIPCFGPSKLAAELEASKAFSKDFFAKHNLPTAAFKNFQSGDHDAAYRYVEAEYAAGREVVVKASGLAAGKGVLMPQSVEEAKAAIKEIMVDKAFGSAGDEVVIEQLLIGEECSCMAFSDGAMASMMVPAQDHKRINDNDEGPNTGGMGAYAPAPCLTSELRPVVEDVLQRTVEALAMEGRKYIGVLYGGFMLTKSGPVLLEYNCRFGDPETQVLLPLLDSDLFDVALGCAEGNLKARVPEVRWKHGAAATVVCAAKGYPGSYPKGLPIHGLPEAGAIDGVKVYHAGTKTMETGLVSSGGRVLTVTGLAPDFTEALRRAYQAVDKIRFDAPGNEPKSLHCRRDIGRRAIEWLAKAATPSAAPHQLAPGARRVPADEIAKPFVLDIQETVAQLPKDRRPKLVGILANSDPAARKYAEWTGKTFQRDGMEFEVRQVETESIEQALEEANLDRSVSGIMIYYPVFGNRPSFQGSSYDDSLRDSVSLAKDVEGLCHFYRRTLYRNQRYVDTEQARKCVLPCTPLAVVKILEHLGAYDDQHASGDRMAGKTVTIVNRSEIVGRPLAAMLANDGAAVYSVDIDSTYIFRRGRVEPVQADCTTEEFVRKSDVVILGVPTESYKMNPSWVKEGAIVVNVASHKNIDEARLLATRPGVRFVPQVGKVTIAMLERNLLRLHQNFDGASRLVWVEVAEVADGVMVSEHESVAARRAIQKQEYVG
eukprot:CAMPEP_0115689052 /NCGR_PEP_ID=MMETSP0272-20121206/61339_1 /TAXON_ID=71861 /ORGANISM="Scrippsiella trochoidea, Strain CCMP3099" /LENGTH=1176 /DNA_ID=CAMNT_0003128783 /DNA_START=42 /DNA_END=3568 /DNA_ORIENTATION=+